MNEFAGVTGGLIQMNSHMEVTGDAMRTIIFGGVTFVVFCVLLLVMLLDGHTDKKRRARAIWICAGFTLAGIALIIIGANMPRDHIVNACASGPVSLDEVAGKYDILEIDGKEMKLRVR